MGKYKDITPKKSAVIAAYISDGLSYSVIAQKLGISKTAVAQVIARFRKTGNYVRQHGSGRPRKTTARDDAAIRRAVVTNPFMTSQCIASSLPLNVSARTVRRRLLVDFKLPYRTPARKPFLTPIQRQKRLKFCKDHQHWKTEEWNKVLFSDESSFCQFGIRAFGVRRPKNTRYESRFTIPTMKKPPKVMIWGSFSVKGRGSLHFVPNNETVNAEKYLALLENKLKPTMAIHGCSIFQQDSAPAHTAKKVTKWFKDCNITLLPWPGNSPDLNPIENLWVIMKRKVSAHAPSNMKDLMYWIKRVWCTEITPQLCEKLVNSMPKRIQHVLKHKGGPTKY